MKEKVLNNLLSALKGKKLIRMAHTLGEGLEQCVLEIPQEIWYKYPTLDEDLIKPHVTCFRAFPNRDRDRHYTYDMVLWKQIADGYLEKMQETPLFFSFKKSTNLEEVCKEYGYKELMPDYKMFKELQDKKRLGDFGVDEAHGEIPFISADVHEIEYKTITHQLGHKFVIQYSFNPQGYNSSGGRDTFVIDNITQFREVRNLNYNTPARISKFIHGVELGVHAVATNRGTIVTDCYLQAIGIPELTDNQSMFCGIDFTSSQALPASVNQQVKTITKKIGESLYKYGYKGVFGVDFLLENQTNKVYVLEINPRFTAATNMMSFLLQKQDLLSPIALHFSEYLDCIPETFSVEEYEQSIAGKSNGSLLYIRNREGKTVQMTKAPMPGIYSVNDEGVVSYVKEGYEAGQLENEDQILVRKFHPLQRDIGPVEVLFEVQSLRNCLEGKSNLSDRWKNIIDDLYIECDFQPANTYDSSVPWTEAK
ncbi:MAG TPA: ATP-grasp domain-containing protein [Candidatus Gracilibacteria bacterium]